MLYGNATFTRCALLGTKSNIVKPVFFHLRGLDHCSNFHLNDFLFLRDSPKECFDDIEVSREVWESVGFIISHPLWKGLTLVVGWLSDRNFCEEGFQNLLLLSWVILEVLLSMKVTMKPSRNSGVSATRSQLTQIWVHKRSKNRSRLLFVWASARKPNLGIIVQKGNYSSCPRYWP